MSAFEQVIKLTQKWEPELFATELQYRDSLADFISANLADIKIEKEYRDKGNTLDIYVKHSGFLSSSEVFIELKRNLLQKSQLDRLVGQIASLRECALVVALCGETSPALFKRLTDTCHLSKTWDADVLSNTNLWGDQGIAVILKSQSSKAAKSSK